MDENEKDIKAHLTRLIDNFARQLPDSPRVTADLWKFAKMHDRRNYQLLKFCIAPESDYRTVFKAFVCVSTAVYVVSLLTDSRLAERILETDRGCTWGTGRPLGDAHSPIVPIECPYIQQEPCSRDHGFLTERGAPSRQHGA